MILDAFTISWFLAHPDHLLLLLKTEARRSKLFYGKRTPARRAWKNARKATLRWVRALSDLEELDDDAEVVAQDPASVRETSEYKAVSRNIAEYEEAAQEALENALKVEFEESEVLPWFKRTTRRSEIRRRAEGLILSEEGTPWQRAWSRARGVFF